MYIYIMSCKNKFTLSKQKYFKKTGFFSKILFCKILNYIAKC